MTSQELGRKKVSQLYSNCLAGIPMMNTLQRLAFKISELQQASKGKKAQEKEYASEQTQTDAFEQLEQRRILPMSTQSLRRIQQFGQISQKDELLQQTIEKYEKLIESLYDQIETLQEQNEQKIIKIHRQCEIKVKQAEKGRKPGKIQPCSCPTDQLEKQIKRLEGEIKKRDKDLIKRLHNKI